MSKRAGYPQKARNPRSEVASVSWRPNGTSSPTVIFGKGVASVARSATGKFKITMDDSNWLITGAHHTLVTAAGITTPVIINTLYSDGYRGNSGSSFVNIEYRQNGTLSNITAGTTEMISTVIHLADSQEAV